MSGAVLAFPGCALPSDDAPTFGGLTLAVGTWLYSAVPASERDCGVVERVEGDTGVTMRGMDWNTGGLRPLPRTRVWVRWDGGTAPARPVEHLTTASLLAFRESNGLTGYFGFLAARFPNKELRADFVRYRSEAPARRAEAARLADEERERVRREVGPWFADLEAAHCGRDRGGSVYLPDTVEAKVIRRACKELAGVRVKVGVRRYSMASGLSFGGRYTEAEAARVNAIFPGIIQRREYRTDSNDYNDPARDVVWEGCYGLHPRARDDRSDLSSDYHDPGGFRVANAYLLDVCRILSEEIERAAK